MTPAPLYRRVLGERYDLMPEPLRKMHDVSGRQTAAGIASVERGQGPAARLIAWVFRFPRAGTDVPVTVDLIARNGGEIWERHFSGKKMLSIQEEGRAGLLIERFGPFAFSMAVTVDAGRLSLHMREGWVLGVPLPGFVLPRITAFEHDAGDRFNFHVDLALPVIGRVVRYIGWLEPVEAPTSCGTNRG